MDTENLDSIETPDGTLMLRTMSMPANANPNGDVFGGWLMSQLDAGGAMMAYEMTRGRVVTIAAEKMVFKKPVKVGDVVCCYGRVVHIGNTSLSIKLELWTRRNSSERVKRMKVTETVFTYVGIDDNGEKRPLPDFLHEREAEILEKGYIE